MLLAFVVACIAASTSTSGFGASSDVDVSADVVSSVWLTDRCGERGGWSFGPIPAGQPVLTDTGTDVCSFDFGSNNSSAPADPATVASLASAGSGSVELVWGMRTAPLAPPARHTAGIVVEAVAPGP